MVPQLAAAIEDAVLAALSDGSIDKDTLRQIVVGPSPDRQGLHLWSLDTWEDYGEHSTSDAFAEIEYRALLDDVDALLPGHLPSPMAHEPRKLPRDIVFTDATLDLAYEGYLQKHAQLLVDALRAVAKRQRLGSFENLVGLLAKGVSTSGYADLVAFYHPRGHEKLWPVHERREGGISVYQWAALTDDGVVMFYAEDEDGQPPGVKEYRFADMERWEPDDSDIKVRMKGDVHDIEFSHGHCHDEWGLPSQTDVDEALLLHFGKHPELRVQEGPMPALDSPAFPAWQKAFTARPYRAQYEFVRKLLAEHGIPAARAFVDALPKEHEQHSGLVECLATAMVKTAPAEALAIFQALPAKARARAWRDESDALMELGRFDDVVALCAKVANDDQDDAAPRAALALARQGKRDEALARLDARPAEERTRARSQWARAVALMGHDEQGALDAFRRAVADNSRLLEQAAQTFGRSSAVTEELRARQEMETARAAMGDEVRARRTTDTAPIVTLDPEGAIALAYTGSGAPTVTQWRTIGELSIDKGGRVRALRRDDKGRTWASAQTAGLVEIVVGKDGALRAGSATRSTGSIEGLTLAGTTAYGADWSVGLSVFSLNDEGKAKHLVTHPHAGPDATSKVSASGTLVALCSSGGVELYDVHTPSQPALRAIVGVGATDHTTHCQDAVLVGSSLFVACGETGLVIVDVEDPQAPRVLACLSVDEGGKVFRAEGVFVDDGIAVVSWRGRAWLVDVTDPRAPRSVCVLGEDGTKADFRAWLGLGEGAEGARRYGVVDEDHPILWVFDVWTDRPAKLVRAEHMVNAQGAATSHYYAESALLLSSDRMLIGKDSGAVVLLERHDVPALDTRQVDDIRAMHAPATTWINERLAEYADEHPDGGIGLASVGIQYGTLTLTLAPAVSVSGAVVFADDDEGGRYTIELSELAAADHDGGGGDDKRDRDPDEGQKGAVLRHLKDAAQQELEQACAQALLDAPMLAELMAGRLYLARGATILEVRQRTDRAWTPHRRVIEAQHAKTLAERITDHRNWGPIAEKASSNAALRAEIYALLEEGSEGALHVTRRFYKADKDGCVAALLRAATKRPLPLNHLELLGRFAVRDNVRPTLESMWSELLSASDDDLLDDWQRPTDTAMRVLQLAQSLGKKDDDKIVQLVRLLLGVPKLRYDTMDFAGAAMDTLDDTMPSLLAVLQAALARIDDHDNRLPLLCRHLFRAGHRALPPALQAQAKREKSGEQYDDIKLGIAVLDDVPDNAVARTERLYTGWMLAERVRALSEANDVTNSVWPPSLPAEPHPSSWKRVLAAAVPHLLQMGLLERFVDMLAVRAVPGDAFVADRAFLLGMLEHHKNRQDWVRHAQLVDVITASAGFDDATKRRIEKHQERVELHRGWEHLKARELQQARVIADELLDDDPDGQVLFFDARLRWLEQGTPQAAIDAARAHLENLSGYDPTGRGRLLNLIGAALDELGKVAEAMSYFEKAAQAHPEESMYLANLAEGHDKLGNTEQAVRFAREALLRKADSAVCRRIIGAS